MQLPAHLNQEIELLFKRMDRAYDQVARPSGFVCRGCEDNCCLTRFHHHTVLEYLFLRSGLAQMPGGEKDRVRRQALSAVARMLPMQRRGQAIEVMCPLNVAGKCSLYAWRPMICRLHGLPHLLRRPDGQARTGPGCDDFYTQVQAPAGHELDRTSLYVDMADLELRLRHHLGFHSKIKMTVAEMIVNEIH